jgi:hypothetical protein
MGIGDPAFTISRELSFRPFVILSMPNEIGAILRKDEGNVCPYITTIA